MSRPVSSAGQVGSESTDLLSADGLSLGQQQRLTELLDQYLSRLETGQSVDVELMLRQNPDVAEPLRVYLQKLDGLRGIAPGFQDHGDLEPLVTGQAPSQVNSLELGDYTIVRELGRGGMGIVYEATQRSLDRRVALKLLPMASMLDPRQITRFKNESHAAAQLQHPNIVPVYNVGLHRGIHHYAMQFIEGQTVDQWIESSVATGDRWKDSVSMAVHAADALHCAHEGGIVHRDIKPSNLMIDHAGKVWVTDFGLARCQSKHSVTLSGNLVGTLRYMSPEQADGRAELVDHRTDIYSLGATLFEMLTGEAAIQGEDGSAVLRQIIDGVPPKLRRNHPELPVDLEVVLQKSMASDRDDRYVTMLDFADDLKAVLANRPTAAKPLSLPKRLLRWTKRHQRLSMFTALAATLVLGLATLGVLANGIIISEKNRDIEASAALTEVFFLRAQDAVDDLGSRYSTQLASVPGAEHIRQAMMQDTLRYYQEFAAQAQGNSKLLAQLALTHSRMGGLVQELDSPQAAIKHYQEAAKGYQALLDDSPQSHVLRQAVSKNFDQLGLALLASGKVDEAKQSFERAIEIQSQLLQQSNSQQRTNLRADLACTQSNLGLLHRRVGNESQSQESLNTAIEHFEKVIEVDPNHVLATRGIAAALGTLSSLQTKSNPQSSIRLLERAIEFQLRIAQDSSARLKASNELATTYNGLGSAYLEIGELDKSSVAFSNAVRLFRQLNSIAPLVDSYRLDLAMCLNNQASLYQERNDLESAIAAAIEAVQIQQACLKSASLDAANYSRLAVMFSNLGTLQEKMERLSESRQSFQASVDNQLHAVAIEPNRNQFHSYLFKHYADLLRVQVRTQSYQAAAKTSDQYRDAAKREPSQLVQVAIDLASVSAQAEERWRLHAAKDIGSALLAARETGLELDPNLLSAEPFRSFADAPRLREAMKP
ncbi:MAG: protein kinase [Rubripirellula sp.]